MDLYLSHEKIRLAKNVLTTSLTQEETIEMIVPDALPDILRVIDTDATLLVRSKDTDAGRVSVSGVAAVTVLYCPEDAPGVRKMTVEIPFTVAAADSEVLQTSKVVSRVSLISADAVIVNPRKFIARIDILAEISCYNDVELAFCADIDAAADSGIELLHDSFMVNSPVDVKEKSFVISDNVSLPGTAPAIGELLKTRVRLMADEAKVVGNKVIFRGRTNFSLLYNSDDADELCSADLSSEFSQIMELETMSGDGEFDIVLMLTGAYFQSDNMDGSDNRTLNAELHVVAQCVAAEMKSVSYISDAYSTKFELTHEAEMLEIESKSGATRQSAVIRGTLETDSGIARIVSIDASPGIVEYAIEGSDIAVRCSIYVNCVYECDDGQIMAISGRFEADSTIDEYSKNHKYAVTAECTGEIYGTVAGNGIELRVPVDFVITESVADSINPISAMSYDDAATLDTSKLPSLMISRVGGEDTLWRLAKRHYSTTELILSANGLEDENDISSQQMLIIPKKR